MIDIKEFEKAVKKIDHNKYHICREVGYVSGEFGLKKWSIFRKDMSVEEYFSAENLEVLSSEKGNTLEDIINFAKKEKKIL